MKPALIIHGGAWDWPDALDAPKSESLKHALKIGWDILLQGGSALDAVEKAVNWLEDDPLFDAGTGSHLTRDGVVEMDALIIDGHNGDFGAVASVQRVQYPISLARRVLDSTAQNFFVGAGADALALRIGIPHIPNMALVSDAELTIFRQGIQSGGDTVGAVALDQAGNIAVATSTGGTPLKPAGRVGDAPIFGAGGYADTIAGAGATGQGEHSLRLLLSHRVVAGIAAGQSPQEAANNAIAHADERFERSMLGTITLDHQGQLGAAHSTPKLSCGWIDANGQPRTSMRGGVLSASEA